MKKVLLTAAAVSVLATSSAYAMEDMFYVKAQVGWSKLNDYKGSVKYKSKNDVHFGVGAGYHVMDNARVDLTFDHYANTTHKKSFTNPTKQKIKAKVKGEINTLLLNGYFDVFNVDALKVFVGAGVGVAQVKAKLSRSIDGVAITELKAKQKYNFSYAAHLGASYELTQGVSAELVYSYRAMGKTKKFKGTTDSVNYKGHHVTAGVRFDI
jgi:opacity protein-like surface antigen